jgi:hypothetical protein
MDWSSLYTLLDDGAEVQSTEGLSWMTGRVKSVKLPSSRVARMAPSLSGSIIGFARDPNLVVPTPYGDVSTSLWTMFAGASRMTANLRMTDAVFSAEDEGAALAALEGYLRFKGYLPLPN